MLLLLSLLGCRTATDLPDPPVDVSAKLTRFADCADFGDTLVDSFTEELVAYRYGYWGWAEDGAGGDDGGGGPSDYSTTNVQEEGVDEPDIVKTDGEWIYVVQTARPELTILASWPPESTEVVGRLELEGWPYATFLRGDRLAVYQYVYDDSYGMGTDTPSRQGYALRVTLVDVADRTRPEVLRSVDLEGWLGDARLIGGDSYLVLNTWLALPAELGDLAWSDAIGLPVVDWTATEEEQEAAREAARAIFRPYVEQYVASVDVADFLPRAYVNDGAWQDGAPILDCADVYHPDGVPQPGLLALVHMDLDGDATPTATGLFANGWTVYASLHNLYIAQSSWYWTWGWGDEPLTTHLHQFALDAADTVYVASGEVEGWLTDQFAMSEYEDHLRVATTEFDWWWGTTETEEVYGNGVYVLAQEGDALTVVGSVTDLAPGEQIYATRFAGEQGWLVTYLQVDPLFSLDLSDPTAPRVTGQLDLPGFSTYMHPLDGGYLLTVGMAGEEDGTTTGFAVKLFDVRDPAAPALVQELVATSDEWSWSDALWDHHAFTFHNGVLTVPLYTYDYDEGTGEWAGFSGMWVVAVDPAGAGLTELGRVDHAELIAESECLYSAYYGDCTDDWWYATMRRGIIMEDKLYTLSDYGVKVSELWTPDDTVATALFWPEG